MFSAAKLHFPDARIPDGVDRGLIFYVDRMLQPAVRSRAGGEQHQQNREWGLENTPKWLVRWPKRRQLLHLVYFVSD